MKEPQQIVVPYHRGLDDGEDVICLHTDLGNVLRLYDNRMEYGECKIPEIPLIPRSAFKSDGIIAEDLPIDKPPTGA